MALPTNTFRRKRYFRSKFRQGKFLLAAEATDIQLESFEDLRDWILQTYGNNVAVGTAFRSDQISSTEIRLRPGEAWSGGLPFVMKSGTDSRIISGILQTGISVSDLSATISDIGGKTLDLSGGLADGSYSVVLEAQEELVKESGSGAVDAFLEGTNVGEGTEHKLRLVYKIHTVDTSDLTTSPTYPLSGAGITNHFVNEIVLVPSATENFLISATDITPDTNGADRSISLNNSAGQIPFSSDADEFIFGKLEDSDGNLYAITSISTADAGATVQMLLDREVDIGVSIPKAGLPIITNGVSYKLLKRDHHVTDGTGVPLGRRYYRIADFSFAAGAITSLNDTRVVTEVNSFGVDANVRLTGGGEISWDEGINTLTHSLDFDITIPGLTGVAHVPTPPGSIVLPSNGDVAFFLLDREAAADFDGTVTVTAKQNVPSNVDVYIFAERRSDRIYFPHNGSIGDQETGLLGAFGAAFNKDLSLDLITDSLTENQMDDIFAETFDRQEFVDLAETVNMTSEPFLKQFKATAAARFIDYGAVTLPSADPTNPWTNIGAQSESVSLGILTLTDASVGDQIAYTRTESNLISTSHTEGNMRLRVTADSGTNPYTYELRDGTKHFGLSVSTIDARLIDGSGSSLFTFVLDGTVFHDYRLVKIGNKAIEFFVDDSLLFVQDYSSVTTGAGGNNDIVWGTTVTPTATVEVDSVDTRIYASILQSLDLFRTTSVFYNGDVVPASDAAAPWTVEDGGGGITEVPTSGKLVVTDTIGTNRIAYHRDESSIVRHGDAELEFRLDLDSGSLSSFDQFGLRIEDGKKDLGALIRDDAGTLKVGLYDVSSNTLRSTETVIAADEFSVIKVKKKLDNTVELWIDCNLKDSVPYDLFTDTSSNNRMSFGSFDNTSQYEATMDYVQYSVGGAGPLSCTPVNEFLCIVNSDDPLPIIWISTDNGISWHECIEGIATVISDLQLAGGNIIARIGLSAANAVLTDYGVLYNRTALTDIQTLEVKRIVYQQETSGVDPIPAGSTYVELSGSGTRTLTSGEFAGQQLVLSGEVGGGTSVLIQAAGSNVKMPSDFTVSEFDAIEFVWNGSFWLEKNRSNN